MNKEKILLGTSGWSYKEWRNIIYPLNLPSNKMLQYYSFFFNSVEINSSFYNIPSKKSVELWQKSTPSSFLFSAKIPKSISHDALLNINESNRVIYEFIRNFEPLLVSGKFLAFLLQLPPHFGDKKDEDKNLLIKFLEFWNNEIISVLNKYSEHIPSLVIEFRNIYWNNEEIYNLLRKNDITFCAVIEPVFPAVFEITSNKLFYLRFHGFNTLRPWFKYNFSSKELEHWCVKFKESILMNQSNKNDLKKIAIYFNNHFNGYAVKNSLEFAKLLNLDIKNNTNFLTKPLDFFIDKKNYRKESQIKLDKFL